MLICKVRSLHKTFIARYIINPVTQQVIGNTVAAFFLIFDSFALTRSYIPQSIEWNHL